MCPAKLIVEEESAFDFLQNNPTPKEALDKVMAGRPGYKAKTFSGDPEVPEADSPSTYGYKAEFEDAAGPIRWISVEYTTRLKGYLVAGGLTLYVNDKQFYVDASRIVEIEEVPMALDQLEEAGKSAESFSQLTRRLMKLGFNVHSWAAKSWD